MELSNNGRIILIDDNPDEIQPLMETLSSQGIPYLFYNGEVNGLPKNPFEGIRYVFLDIVLKGMQGQDDKTKASGLTNRLIKLISKSNGPYVIIFWTRHNEVIEQVIDNCKKESIEPVRWLNLEKNECLDMDNNYNIDKIVGSLKSKLSDIGAFRLYVEWENIVNTASKRFVNKFSSLVESGDKWSKNTSALFYKLYKTYVGKNVLTDKTEEFRCASHLMNRSFLDTLESMTSTMLELPEKFKIEDGNIDEETIAKLNSSLFLEKIFLDRSSTGNVYEENNEILLDILKKNMFKEKKAPSGCKLCKLIITPECDLAQNKTLKEKDVVTKKDHKIHRIVYGLLVPIYNDLFANIKDNDAKFDIGTIWYDNRIQLLFINLLTIAFQSEVLFVGKPLFALKRDLLFDLQSKASNHVNRLGNFQLSK